MYDLKQMEKWAWELVQQRLLWYGDYLLRIDGIPGVGTRNAIVKFKERNRLRARPKLGPLTMDKLLGDKAVKAEVVIESSKDDDLPATVRRAMQWIGTREIPGERSEEAIMRWAEQLDIRYSNDDIPWCGLFAAEVNTYCYPKTPQNFNRLGARQWNKWGVSLGSKASDARLGCTAVLWRGERSGWKGHVIPAVTAISADGKYFAGIGGNQGNEVSEEWFEIGRVLHFRTPRHMVKKLTKPPVRKVGALSTTQA